MIRFNENEIRVMGRTASGVKGIELSEGCFCVGAEIAKEGQDVLVVTEKETVLGEELTAKRVDVKVEKRDGEYAAVTEGVLGRNDKIIIDSNKTVEDGDRVRLETE